METKEIFAQRIIELRKEKGWNQAQLAEMVGVSRTSANLYESSTRVPDIQVLAKYAECLGVTADYLLGLSDNRTTVTAAIGEKIGLSEEAINRLIEATEVVNRLPKYDNGKPRLDELIFCKSKNGNYTKASASRILRILSILCLENKLLFSMDDYLKSIIPDELEKATYGYFESIDWSEITSEEAEEIMDIIRAANLCKIQRELDKLYQKINGQHDKERLETAVKLKETTNAQKDKRQE